MVMAFMGRGGIPDIPDPTKIAGAGAETAKSVVTGGVSVGMDIAEGFRKLLTQSTDGGIKTVEGAVREMVNTLKADIEIGKTTIEAVRRDIDQACNSALSQLDQGIGREVVLKLKSEVEKQLR